VKILVLCVSWFARKLVYRRTDGRTDGHGDNISVFFPMRKKALKTRMHSLPLPHPGSCICQALLRDECNKSDVFVSAEFK